MKAVISPLRRIAALLVCAAGAFPLCAVAAEPGDGSLRSVREVQQSLVEAAFASNLSLAREAIEVDRATEALRAARARFYPELSLEARYSRNEGGRTLEFPAGQLLNPAYQTLNELLVAQGQAPRFGMLGDPSIPFLRDREQDTHIALRQPLYQPAIPAAVAAQRELLRGAQFQRLVFANQLHHDVSLAYLQHLKARRAALIVASAAEVLAENLRVTDSLFRNGRVTEDQVLRARAEQLAVQQQQREADDAIAQSRRYLNFLLNRALDTPVEDARLVDDVAPAVADSATLATSARDARAELSRLDALEAAARAQVSTAKARLKPSLSLGVDAGTQGEEYRTGPGYNYLAASLVLTWKFFDGGANRAALAEARLAERSAALARRELAQSIELEVRQAAEALATSTGSLDAARGREAAARAALRIAARKRDEGAISQVEFIDARNALTQAELNLNLVQFDVLAHGLALERATGTATLPPLPGGAPESR